MKKLSEYIYEEFLEGMLIISIIFLSFYLFEAVEKDNYDSLRLAPFVFIIIIMVILTRAGTKYFNDRNLDFLGNKRQSSSPF